MVWSGNMPLVVIAGYILAGWSWLKHWRIYVCLETEEVGKTWKLSEESIKHLIPVFWDYMWWNCLFEKQSFVWIRCRTTEFGSCSSESRWMFTWTATGLKTVVRKRPSREDTACPLFQKGVIKAGLYIVQVTPLWAGQSCTPHSLFPRGESNAVGLTVGSFEHGATSQEYGAWTKQTFTRKLVLLKKKEKHYLKKKQWFCIRKVLQKNRLPCQTNPQTAHNQFSS